VQRTIVPAFIRRSVDGCSPQELALERQPLNATLTNAVSLRFTALIPIALTGRDYRRVSFDTNVKSSEDVPPIIAKDC